MKEILKIDNLHVSLQDKEILRGISFSVAQGECLGILGESGSGKSMSIKAAMGLLDKSFKITGSTQFMGRELQNCREEELRRLRGSEVGMVLQNPMVCFDPLYNIGYQIAETYSAHAKLSKNEIYSKSIAMLEKMNIRDADEVLKKYPHQLSGGMLQRIMIGLATSMQPKLIIADEPTTAIDAINQFEILNEFIKIKEKHNTALIFISHDLDVISKVADRIIVLNSGRVVDQGNFNHILYNAKDEYTKLLIQKREQVTERYKRALRGDIA